jgi:hypothetical protein
MSRQIRLGFLILCAAVSARAYVEKYLPLTQAELAQRVPQKPIPADLLSGEEVHFGTATIRLDENRRLVIDGKDNGGLPWEVVASADWRWQGGEIFSCDLDHNGIQDLVFVGYTGANGSAPSSYLLTLMFAGDGRPVPSEFDGYFEADRWGVKELLDLNRDGHAELVRQSFNHGYWITSLYEARDGHWFLVHGKRGARSFPLYTRYTDRPNRVATTPSPGRNPLEDDLSNSAIVDQAPVRIDKLEWPGAADSTDPSILLGDGRTCRLRSATVEVVLDREAGRQSAIMGAAQDAKRLLEEIVREKLPVRLSGHRAPEDGPSDVCAPELIWAGGR